MEVIYSSFMELLDRGKLLAPSSEHLSHLEVVGERDQPPQEGVHRGGEHGDEDAQLTGASCPEGHKLVDNLMRKMADALFNLFPGNMARDINKPEADTGGDTRSQSEDKRRKLTYVKKR